MTNEAVELIKNVCDSCGKESDYIQHVHETGEDLCAACYHEFGWHLDENEREHIETAGGMF